MTTEKQINANRQNAQLSSGAITSDGKSIVSKNAIKHGIFTKDLIITDGDGKENLEDYEELLNNLIADFTPNGQMEYLLVEKIAVDFWRLKRVLRFETGSTRKYLDMVINDYYNPSYEIGFNSKTYKTNEVLAEAIRDEQKYINWYSTCKKVLESGNVTFDAPKWENDRITIDVEDDLYRVVEKLEYGILTDMERMLFDNRQLDFNQLKKITARAGYTDKDIAESLLEFIEEETKRHKKEIEDLKKQKLKNILAEENSVRLNILPKDKDAEKAMRYEHSLQRSIMQNIAILKKLQFSRQQTLTRDEIGFVS